MAPIAPHSSSTVGPSRPAAADDNQQSFPNIALEDVAALIFSEFDETILAQDMAKPTSALVMRIFSMFLGSLSGLTEEDLMRHTEEIISRLDYPVSRVHGSHF